MGMIHAEVLGVDVVVEGLRDLSLGGLKGAFLGVIEGLQLAQAASTNMISEHDHTLKDLAELGHPYGRKHPFDIHDPDEIVHIQSGDYIAALKVEKPISYADASIIEGEVHIDDSMAQLDQEIQLGTPSMRPRPWADRVVTEHGEEMTAMIEGRIMDALEAEGAR